MSVSRLDVSRLSGSASGVSNGKTNIVRLDASARFTAFLCPSAEAEIIVAAISAATIPAVRGLRSIVMILEFPPGVRSPPRGRTPQQVPRPLPDDGYRRGS